MKRLAVVLSAFVVVLALTGCSAASLPGSTSSPAAKGAASPTPAAPSASPSKKVDVCTALSTSEVASITGRSYLTSASSSDATTSACQYFGDGGADSSLNLGVGLYYGGGASIFAQQESGISGGTATELSGFGDKAVYKNGTVVALFGQDVIVASDYHPDDVAALSTSVLEKIITTLQKAR
jgi:hypothetical protein